MNLYNYLKQFKNIAWYPSAFKDSLSKMCLSHKSLKEYGIKKVVNKNNELGVVLSFDNEHIIVKYPNDEKT